MESQEEEPFRSLFNAYLFVKDDIEVGGEVIKK